MTPLIPFEASNASVRKQLDTILASPEFANAERLSRFLRLAVQKVLDGKGDEIKKYVVGVEVFGRLSSYDPRSDPVVRVEARRLRARLSEYYSDAAASLQAALREYPSDADTTAHLGVIQSRLGKKDGAQRIIAALENPGNSEQKSYYQMAFPCGALGDKERAFISLNRAYEQHSSDMPILNVDPAFDSLRSDAGFRLIQKKMGWAD